MGILDKLGLTYQLVDVNTDDLTLSPNNIRKIYNEKEIQKLADSIHSTNGPFQPPVINQHKQVIAGGRRWRASKLANIKTIKCLVAHFENPIQELIVSWLENSLREEISDTDEGVTIYKLKEDHNLTYEDISKISGISPSTLHGLYRLVTPTQIQIENEEEQGEKQEEVELTEPTEVTEAEKVQEEIDEIWKKTSHRRRKLLDQAIRSRLFNKEENLYDLAKFVEWSEKAPLHAIEEKLKGVKLGIVPDLEFDVEIRTKPHVHLSMYWDEDAYKDFMLRCKREHRDFNKTLYQLGKMFSNYEINPE